MSEKKITFENPSFWQRLKLLWAVGQMVFKGNTFDFTVTDKNDNEDNLLVGEIYYEGTD